MRLKRILDISAVVLFAVAVFGLGWSLAGRSLDLEEISKNIEAVVYESRISTELIQSFNLNDIYRKNLRLVFVGDVMLSRGVAYQIRKNGDFNYPFLKIADYLNSFDLTVGNLEGPISDKGKNQGSIYSFRADPRLIEGLKYAGFDVMSLANNHIMDWGREALIDTRELLETGGIKTVGAGKDYSQANSPAVFEVKGQRIAFLNYTDLYLKSLSATEVSAGVSDFNAENIEFRIKDLEKNGYLVIVLMHWGEEYQTKSNASQQKLARGFVDAGASMVVGHHSHVPQEIEQYGSGWIVYSLGNFVFDQNFSKETMRGMVVEVEVKKGEVVQVNPREVEINSTFQPFLASE